MLGLDWSGDMQMYWIKLMRITFLKGLLFIQKKLWLCIYKIITLLVSYPLAHDDVIQRDWIDIFQQWSVHNGAIWCHCCTIGYL